MFFSQLRSVSGRVGVWLVREATGCLVGRDWWTCVGVWLGVVVSGSVGGLLDRWKDGRAAGWVSWCVGENPPTYTLRHHPHTLSPTFPSTHPISQPPSHPPTWPPTLPPWNAVQTSTLYNFCYLMCHGLCSGGLLFFFSSCVLLYFFVRCEREGQTQEAPRVQPGRLHARV